MKTLTCRTAAYFDQAAIKWVAHPPQPGLGQVARQLFGQSKTMRTADGNSFYQESQIDVTIREEDDGSYIDCSVWSGDTRVDTRVRLNIIRE